MSEKQPLGELLIEALNDIEEVGGRERHTLREVIGKPAYTRLIASPKGADIVTRWLDASGKARGPATKALALHIARLADRADLTGRIEREINDAFDEPAERSPTPIEARKHAAAVNQKRNGQRVAYEKPKSVDLAQLARRGDLTQYMKARQGDRK